MLLLVRIITMIWKLYISHGLNSFCRIRKAHLEEEPSNFFLEKEIKNWGWTTNVVMCIIHTMVLSWLSFNQRKPAVAIRNNRGRQNMPLLCNARYHFKTSGQLLQPILTMTFPRIKFSFNICCWHSLIHHLLHEMEICTWITSRFQRVR